MPVHIVYVCCFLFFMSSFLEGISTYREFVVVIVIVRHAL